MRHDNIYCIWAIPPKLAFLWQGLANRVEKPYKKSDTEKMCLTGSRKNTFLLVHDRASPEKWRPKNRKKRYLGKQLISILKFHSHRSQIWLVL